MIAKNNNYFALLFLSSMLFLTACKKETFIPGDNQETYISFYNGADALIQYGAITGYHRIEVTEPLPGARQITFPGSVNFNQFPRTLTGTDFIVDNIAIPNDVNYQIVYWLPVKAGDYLFSYKSCSTDNLIKADLIASNTSLQAKTFTTQYLFESTTSDNTYQTITVPVERKGLPAKVRLQVVNISPDLGPLEVIRTDKNGNELSTNLPKSLATGQYSDYVDLDTAGASQTFGQIFLKVKKSGSNTVLLSSSIPAVSNSSFTMVVQGFAKASKRRVRSIKTNATEYNEVNVEPNLRVCTRRVF